MKSEPAEAQWLLAQAEISCEQLAQVSGLSTDVRRRTCGGELVVDGALDPLSVKAASDARTPPWSFPPST